MNFKKTSQPSDLAVSLADMKLHLRVDHSEDDALITTLILAATRSAESFMEKSISPDTEYTLTLDSFPSGDTITLMYGPVISVDSLSYVDSDGVTQVLTENSDFRVDLNNDLPRIQNIGDSWPDTYERVNAVTIVYTTGFATVPDDIVVGIKMLVSHLYENRQDVITGMNASEIPFASKHLFLPYKQYLGAC